MACGGGIAVGITLEFETTAFTFELLDINPATMHRDSLEDTHQGSPGGWKEFCPSDMIDGGEMTVTGNFDPGEWPPIDQPKEYITITFPNGDTYRFEGFMTDYAPKASLGEKMTFDATVKISGEVIQADYTTT